MGGKRRTGSLSVTSRSATSNRVQTTNAESLGSEAGASFSWTPRICNRAYSLDLPQRLVVPLKDRRFLEERKFSLGPTQELDVQTAAIFGSAPDTLGYAILPGWQSSFGDAVMARIDFLGNLSLDSCSLFAVSHTPSAVPARRVCLKPLVADASDDSWSTASSEEEQLEGKAEAKPKRKRKAVVHPESELTVTPGILKEIAKVCKALQKCKFTDDGKGIEDADFSVEDLQVLGISKARELDIFKRDNEGPLDFVSAGELTPAEVRALQKIIEELEIPMTLAELQRGMRLLTAAADARKGKWSIAQPATVPTKGCVPSFRRSEALSGIIKELKQRPDRHSKELLIWPGAWQLTQLQKNTRNHVREKLDAIGKFCSDRGVQISDHMQLLKQPILETVTDQALQERQAGEAGSSRTHQGSSGSDMQAEKEAAGDKLQALRLSGSLQLVLPKADKYKGEHFHMKELEAESEEARQALEELKQAWPDHEHQPEAAPMDIDVDFESPEQASRPGRQPGILGQDLHQAGPSASLLQETPAGGLTREARAEQRRRRR